MPRNAVTTIGPPERIEDLWITKTFEPVQPLPNMFAPTYTPFASTPTLS